MHTLVGVESYDDAFDKALQVFVTGLPAFASSAVRRDEQPRSSEVDDRSERPVFPLRTR